VDGIGTPALYRTRITHMRRAPAHHYFEHRSYSWYVDVDALPRLPRWLRAFARFDARDHFDGAAGESLRAGVDAFLTARGAAASGGRITALLQPRVLGYAFNPLTLYWCHDRNGVLQHVVAEVHNTHGEQDAYLLPPADAPVFAAKRLYASPFHPVDGHYLVRAPRRRPIAVAAACRAAGAAAGPVPHASGGGCVVAAAGPTRAMATNRQRRQRRCHRHCARGRDGSAGPKRGVVKNVDPELLSRPARRRSASS
jgi:hypothetical protein